MPNDAESMEDTISRLLDGGDSTPEPLVEDPPPEEAAAPPEDALEVPPEETEPAEEPSADRDEHGRFKAKETAPAPKAKTLVKPGTATPATETPPAEPARPAYRPPQSWKPGAREALAKAAPEIQEEAARLDREYRGIMQQNADLRRQHGEATQWRQGVETFVQPYAGILAAEGNGDPMRGLQAVIQGFGQLHHGHPQDRARIVANMLMRFSDVDSVNAILFGQAPAQPQAPQRWGPPPPPPPDPRALVREEFQAMAQRATEARASRDFEAFAATKPEFFDDVADDVERVLRASSRPLTYQQAYEVALRLPGHEDIQAILEQRKASEAAKKQAAAAAKARIAASSVRTSPSVGAPAKPRTLQEEVAAQYETLAGR